MLITNGTTTLVLLFMSIMMTLLDATPATSGSSTSVTKSFSLEKPQNLSKATPSSASSLSSSSTASSSTTTTTTKSSKKKAIALSLAKASPLPSESLFTWGHVTKYSTILYDESFVVKGPIVMHVRYPEIDNSNSFTIIGIQALITDDDNDDGTNSDTVDQEISRTTGNAQLQVHPVMGGIGYNSTIIRFTLNSARELHCTLILHGVDV